MPSGRIPKGDATRERLVGAMADLVQRQGYLATGVSDVAAAAGAPKGSLYHHFPGGKEELGVAALEAAGASIDAAFAAVLRRHRSPVRAVAALAAGMAAGLEASGYERGCPVATSALETAHASEALAAAAAQAFAGWRARLAEHFEAAGFRPADARSRAVLVLSALEGALVLARAEHDVTPLRSVAQQLAPLLTTKET
jgi:TetR/AcrR family transcriptional repressor of lmrAB and yxaGH operons